VPLATPSSSSLTTQDDEASTIVQSIEDVDSQQSSPFSQYKISRPLAPTTPASAPPQWQRAASAPPLKSKTDKGIVHHHAGFMGMTSYSSIFADSQVQGLADLADVTAVDERKCQHPAVPEERILRGCQVLAFLKDRSTINQFVGRFYEIEEGSGFCIEPIMKHWLLRLWVHHESTLSHQDPAQVRQLVELLWKNSNVPMTFDEHTTPSTWIQQATGPGIRWAVIGLIAAVVGNCAVQLMSTDRLLRDSKTTRIKLMRSMHEVVLACLDFCRDCEIIDDMFIWLLLGNYFLTASLKHEFSYAAYHQSGEVINASITMGLHQPARKPPPFFLSEIRKRTFILAYAIEVSTAAFLGRPCRLSYRYSEIQSPKDLDDKQLLLDDDALADALAKLDDKGFNTVGRFWKSTYILTWLSFAPIREQILDLALGNYSRNELLPRAAEIRNEQEARWASLPAWIRRIRNDTFTQVCSPNGGRKMTMMEMLLTFSTRGGFKSNELLLQLVLIRKAGVSPLETLVPLARDILKDILEVCQHTELTQCYPADVSYFLGVQGLRAAAIVATELLKQEQLPNYPRDSLLPRSQTIQDLAVYASRLGAVDPEDGMFVICAQGRRAITQILDKILKPPTPLQPLAPTAAAATSSSPLPYAQDSITAATTQPSPPYITQPHNKHLQVDDQQQHQHHQFQRGITPTMQDAGFVTGAVDIGVDEMSSYWNINEYEYGPPFLGNDHDFMQWLESMNFEAQ
jgi:hypothetical protein